MRAIVALILIFASTSAMAAGTSAGYGGGGIGLRSGAAASRGGGSVDVADDGSGGFFGRRFCSKVLSETLSEEGLSVALATSRDICC